jgi:NAD(P)-dependent dehydrogenase (short-subunit alcohol dehydrogenase family)
MRSVVVTGASTGIGYGTAKVLAGAGYRVYASVRREADATRLSSELGPNVIPLLFDVTDEAAVAAAAATVRAALAGETLAGLVNNAGVAVPGPLLHLPIEDFRRQIEVNLTGQLIVTQAFAPLLGADPALAGPRGRIVMISSVAGRTGAPFLGPYAASKHALEGLSESLRRELMIFGIDVVIVGPATIRTPIWNKAEDLDIEALAGSHYYEPMKRIRAFMLGGVGSGLPPEKVGELVLKILTVARPKVRYAIATSPLVDLAQAVLPKRFIDRLIARRLGLMPKTPEPRP